MHTDPLVSNLAKTGSLCPEYVRMLSLVENRTPPGQIPQDSELKMIEGSLPELRVVQLPSGDRLLCRDSAVFVPKAARENILSTLHLAHHAPGSMIQNAKGRIYWPQMRAQIHQVYTSCVECSLHKISKTRPPNEASQVDLFDNFYPNSYIQCDYFDFRGKPYMTVVCVLTGYGRVFACKDKSTNEALKTIRQWVAL